jgi:hypothetical protein
MKKLGIVRWEGNVTRIEKKYICGNLVGKPKDERQLGRPRRRWEENIKMAPRGIG